MYVKITNIGTVIFREAYKLYYTIVLLQFYATAFLTSMQKMMHHYRSIMKNK